MKITIKRYFPFDICCDLDARPDEMIQFTIGFSWLIHTFSPNWQTTQLLHAESCFCRDDDGLEMVGLPVRHAKHFHPVFRLGPRNNQRSFKYLCTGSGGNMYWESYHLRKASEPHLFNYLRRQKLFSLSEWDCGFVDEVWRRRRSIDREFLDDWGRQQVKTWLAEQAKELGLKRVSDLFPHVNDRQTVTA